jgi:hypothetical protein
MSQKNSFKTMIENFIEDAIVSSSHIHKLISSVTLIAQESKRITELILVLNDRLNTHEELILKLAQANRNAAKDPLDSVGINAKSKQNPPKSN